MKLVNIDLLSESEIAGLEYTVSLRNQEIDQRNAMLTRDSEPEPYWTVQSYADDRARAVFVDFAKHQSESVKTERVGLIEQIEKSADLEDMKLYQSLAERLLVERQKVSEEAVLDVPLKR